MKKPRPLSPGGLLLCAASSAAQCELGRLADVGRRRQCPQFVLELHKNIELIDERTNDLEGNLFATHQFEEFLVSAGHSVSPQDHLNWLGHEFPGILEIFTNGAFIELEFLQAHEQRLVAEQRVTQPDSNIPEHGAVSQVALKATDRQLLGQMPKKRICQAEVPFRVFKIDRIDLVRHCRGTDLAGPHLLLEVVQTHITPEVAAEIDQDRVGSRDRIEQLGHVVMRLDLNRAGVEGETETLLDHASAERLPIDIGVNGQMGVVVTHSTVHLREEPDSSDLVARRDKPHHHVGNFLAHRGWACRLTMSARDHCDMCVGMSHAAQLHDHRVERRQDDLFTGGLQLQRMTGIVDVLART